MMCSGFKDHSFVTSDRHSYLTSRSLNTGVHCRYSSSCSDSIMVFVFHSLNAADVPILIKFIHSAPLTVKWERKEFWLQLRWLRVSEQTVLDWCPAANLQGVKSNSLVSLMLSDFQSHHWLFLQVLVLSRVSKSNVNNSFDHKIMDGIFQFNPLSLASNIYSCRELRLLSWVNLHYQTSRETLWKKGRTHSMCTYIITSSWCSADFATIFFRRVTVCIYFSLYQTYLLEDRIIFSLNETVIRNPFSLL